MLIDGHRGHPAHRDLNFWALPCAAGGYGRAGRRERRSSGGPAASRSRRGYPDPPPRSAQKLQPRSPRRRNQRFPRLRSMPRSGPCARFERRRRGTGDRSDRNRCTTVPAARLCLLQCQRLQAAADVLARRSACRRPRPPQRPLHPRGSTRRSHATPSRNCQTAAAPEPCRCIRTTIVYPGAHSSASGHPEDSSAHHRITPG